MLHDSFFYNKLCKRVYYKNYSYKKELLHVDVVNMIQILGVKLFNMFDYIRVS